MDFFIRVCEGDPNHLLYSRYLNKTSSCHFVTAQGGHLILNMFLSGNFLLQVKILPRVQNASSHTTLQEPHNILTLLSRTRAFTLLFLFSKETLFSCLRVLS